MKIIIFLLLALPSLTIAATPKKNLKKKEVNQDKIYTVEKNSSEIIIGKNEVFDIRNVNKDETIYRRPKDLWYLALVRSSLNYHLPSVTANSLSFSPEIAGVTIGKKSENQFFIYKGYFEMSAEWQRFKREAAVSNGMIFTQKLDLYQFNIFQNFNLAWVLKHSTLFSVGLGIAPTYLTTEQSVFSNSTSELGFMGMIKGNVIVPYKKVLEMDFGLRLGWGAVGSRNIYATVLSAGINFE